MWGDLHEEKTVDLVLEETIPSGKANRLFKELGATLHYNVYSFEASESENWQSESILDVTLYRNDTEVDAQDDFNEIILSYPFAVRPSSDQGKAIVLVQKIISAFNAKAFYQNSQFNSNKVQEDWDGCNTFLLKEWGEEPGSMGLARMIYENYT
ncbi:MAG: hypothetical protein K6L75_05885 [Cellvibrionaceae bacterium]